MTLEQELKQAEENAEALRRKLTLATACKLTALLQEAAAAEEALIAACKALDSANAEWRAHGEEHDYMFQKNTRIDLVKLNNLAKNVRAEYESLQAHTLECVTEARVAQKRIGDAFKAVEEPLKAANEMVRRVELLRSTYIGYPC